MRNYLLQLLPICIFLLLSKCFIYSQDIVQSTKIESHLKNSKNEIIPVGKMGFVMISKGERQKLFEHIYQFALYDTSFQKKWNVEETLSSIQAKSMYYFDNNNNKLYVLLCNPIPVTGLGASIENNKGKIVILSINLSNGHIKKDLRKFDVNAMLQYFQVINDQVFIGGVTVPSNKKQMSKFFCCSGLMLFESCTGKTTWKTKPVIFNINLVSGIGKMLPIALEKTGNVKSMFVTDDGYLKVYIKEYVDKDKVKYWELIYNEDAKRIHKTEIFFDDEYSILTMGYLNRSDDELVFGGNFLSNKMNKRGSFDFNTIIQSQGIFIAKQIGPKIQFTKFYDFDDKLKYMYTHKDIYELNEEYLVIAEEISLIYETYYTTDSQGRSVRNRRFVGYQHDKAFVYAFDEDGEKIWENSFDLDGLERKLHQKVFVYANEQSNSLSLFYSYGGNMYLAEIEDGELNESPQKLDLLHEPNTAKKVSYSNSRISYWYEDYAISWGDREMKIKDKEGKHKKKEFYFNKISLKN